MVFDFDAAKKTVADLITDKSCFAVFSDELEGIIKVLMSLEDDGNYDEIIGELNAQIDELEESTRKLQSMISALESVSSIYRRNERMIVSKLSTMDKKLSKSVGIINIENMVPKDISDLIKYKAEGICKG